MGENMERERERERERTSFNKSTFVLWTFQDSLRAWQRPCVSSFEVCLQLLHLLTLATIFLLDMVALGYDTIDLKKYNAVAVQTRLFISKSTLMCVCTVS